MTSSIAQQHQQEFARMRRGSRSLLKISFFGALVLLILFAIFAGGEAAGPHGTRLQVARQTLLDSGAPWASGMVEQQQQYRDWVVRHGISSELRIFDSISTTAFLNSASVARLESEGKFSFQRRAYLSLQFAVLRISFLVLASLRLWIFVVLGAVVWARRSLRVHTANDILGETSNGRLFYSGIKVGLDRVNEQGLPEKLITGLATLQSAELSTTKGTDLGKVLHHFGAETETSLALASMIVHYAEVPGYVAARDETALLDRSFKGAPLGEVAAVALMNALELQREYRAGRGIHGEQDLAVFAPLEGSAVDKLDTEQYGAYLQRALQRCLTPTMRRELGAIPVQDLAVVILAMEAGKIMAFEKEAGKWVRRSNFPQLSARAVLHSVAAFAQEFNSDSRGRIRRALIYASRSSVYAPVHFPVDLSDSTRALRQWTELLLAGPHELSAVSDDVELYGIVCDAHQAWNQMLLDAIMTGAPEVIGGMYATHGNLFFMPLRTVLILMRKIVSRPILQRLEELVNHVSQKQKLQTLSFEQVHEDGGAHPLMTHERCVTPFSLLEIKQIAERHGLMESEVREWSALRVVLSSFGWIARRVGDYSVPPCSVIFTVFKVEPLLFGSNEVGMLGKPAMVPFRGTRLAQKWGKNWQVRFAQVDRVTMAEDAQDFGKKLEGFEEEIVDEEGALT